jgi:hypothetical protein
MEQSYKNITYLFIAIFMVIFAGFYKTYFGLFPTFDEVTITQHIHSALFIDVVSDAHSTTNTDQK